MAPAFYYRGRDTSGNNWFFYAHNPASNRLAADYATHEGDWESIRIYLDGGGEPVKAEFHKHGCKNTAVPWSKVEKAFSTHPVVYSAKGSHASYYGVTHKRVFGCHKEKGFGDITARGGAIWESYLTGLYAVESELWYHYGGAWGQRGYGSNRTGPLGPKWQEGK
jgi:hypothetical protein